MLVNPGRTLVILGILLICLGLLLTFSGKLPHWGRLPGDLRIDREGFSFYFPLGTCLILSLLLSLLLWLFRK